MRRRAWRQLFLGSSMGCCDGWEESRVMGEGVGVSGWGAAALLQGDGKQLRAPPGWSAASAPHEGQRDVEVPLEVALQVGVQRDEGRPVVGVDGCGQGGQAGGRCEWKVGLPAGWLQAGGLLGSEPVN